jgi:hypothetical protein
VVQSIADIEASGLSKAKLTAIWNALPDATKLAKFKDRKVAAQRLWAGFAELPVDPERVAGSPTPRAGSKQAQAAGAEFLICPDNTIHQAMDYVAPRSPLPWLHLSTLLPLKRQPGATGASACSEPGGWSKATSTLRNCEVRAATGWQPHTVRGVFSGRARRHRDQGGTRPGVSHRRGWRMMPVPRWEDLTAGSRAETDIDGPARGTSTYELGRVGIPTASLPGHLPATPLITPGPSRGQDHRPPFSLA